MGNVEGKLGRGIAVTARVWVSGAAVAFALSARALGCGGDASESLGDRSDAAVTGAAGAANPAAAAGGGRRRRRGESCR